MSNSIINISSTYRCVFVQRDASTNYGLLVWSADHIRSITNIGGTSYDKVEFVFADGSRSQLDLTECDNANYNAGTATAMNNFMSDIRTIFTPAARDKAETVVAKSADYTVLTTDDIVEVTTGAADKTMTLPAAASMTGRSLTFVKVDGGAGKVVLDGNASETINGATTNNEIDTQYDSLTIYSNGTAWYISVKRLA